VGIALDHGQTWQTERTLPLKALGFKMHRQRPRSVDEGNTQTGVL